MKHHETCAYFRCIDPKAAKPECTEVRLSDHERVMQCNSCGAFDVVPKPYNPLVERLIQHTIRAEDEFWQTLKDDLRPSTQAEFNEQYLCTPTGRKPSEPELQRLPGSGTVSGRLSRRDGHVLCLTTNTNGGDLRWTNTLMLGPQSRVAGMFVVQIDDLAEPYCPVRFLPFYDIHARDREGKR